jgi:hypothetical protein
MSNLFPKSANKLPLQIIIFLFVFGGIATAGVTYYMTPKYTRVGYAPVQPVPFSHALHSGQLGLIAVIATSGVDKGPASTVPPFADLHELPQSDQGRQPVAGGCAAKLRDR